MRHDDVKEDCNDRPILWVWRPAAEMDTAGSRSGYSKQKCFRKTVVQILTRIIFYLGLVDILKWRIVINKILARQVALRYIIVYLTTNFYYSSRTFTAELYSEENTQSHHGLYRLIEITSHEWHKSYEKNGVGQIRLQLCSTSHTPFDDIV